MCGIVGYVGLKEAQAILMEGLSHLEYRGYDSAGIAVLAPEHGERTTQIRRCAGKLKGLQDLLKQIPVFGHVGIGHTRWATHGKPTEQNAHPHSYQGITIVHNGIVENHAPLRHNLMTHGHVFASETDSEVIAHLIAFYKQQGMSFEDATMQCVNQLRGAFALAVIDEATPDRILTAQMSCPMVIGKGEAEAYVASDVTAFLNYTKDFYVLEEGDIGIVTKEQIYIHNLQGSASKRALQHITWSQHAAQKNGHPHFMHKEIYEQPHVLTDTLRERVDVEEGKIHLDRIPLKKWAHSIDQIAIGACGSAYLAGLLAKSRLEEWAQIPVEVDLASEFRYRSLLIHDRTLFIAISQSGETADTIGALQLAQKHTPLSLAVCNVMGATIPRLCEASLGTLYTRCGPEKSVASTKAFLAQVICMDLIALELGFHRQILSTDLIKEYLHHLALLPKQLLECLKTEQQIAHIAKQYANVEGMLFLGRGPFYPIALEGALKMKELAYIHANGYAAGEMKHGPLALVDGQTPIIALAAKNHTYPKLISNIEEARARGGQIISICTPDCTELIEISNHAIVLPEVDSRFAPLCATVPLQLFAYHMALARGNDVDKPRNLAKSVTVE